MLNFTCDTASITTDLWTSCATDQMELRDIPLCIEPIKYPHTVKEFNLINKITTAITDNGCNMVKAIQEWEDYVEQNEKLEEAQAESNAKLAQHDLQNQIKIIIEERQPHILRTITEVSTRLGFALASWRRLRELKPAIRRALVNLIIETLKYSYATENDNNKNNDENCDNENNDDENSDEDNKEIYNALDDYFDNPHNATILASLLDPRSKQMHGWLEELNEKTTSLLRSEYKEEEESLKETKHSYYLDEIKTPQALPEVDPFE
ncbi:10122_t:CDS:2 [Rhizophagus irregularis]|nr:10122_t:CDS:2 [Rhizophagus irregularis]